MTIVLRRTAVEDFYTFLSSNIEDVSKTCITGRFMGWRDPENYPHTFTISVSGYRITGERYPVQKNISLEILTPLHLQTISDNILEILGNPDFFPTDNNLSIEYDLLGDLDSTLKIGNLNHQFYLGWTTNSNNYKVFLSNPREALEGMLETIDAVNSLEEVF